MTKRQRRKAATLVRRRRHLEEKRGWVGFTGRSYDRAEVAAIAFALKCVEKLEAAGLLTPEIGEDFFDTVDNLPPEEQGDQT